MQRKSLILSSPFHGILRANNRGLKYKYGRTPSLLNTYQQRVVLTNYQPLKCFSTNFSVTREREARQDSTTKKSINQSQVVHPTFERNESKKDCEQEVDDENYEFDIKKKDFSALNRKEVNNVVTGILGTAKNCQQIFATMQEYLAFFRAECFALHQYMDKLTESQFTEYQFKLLKVIRHVEELYEEHFLPVMENRFLLSGHTIYGEYVILLNLMNIFRVGNFVRSELEHANALSADLQRLFFTEKIKEFTQILLTATKDVITYEGQLKKLDSSIQEQEKIIKKLQEFLQPYQDELNQQFVDKDDVALGDDMPDVHMVHTDRKAKVPTKKEKGIRFDKEKVKMISEKTAELRSAQIDLKNLKRERKIILETVEIAREEVARSKRFIKENKELPTDGLKNGIKIRKSLLKFLRTLPEQKDKQMKMLLEKLTIDEGVKKGELSDFAKLGLIEFDKMDPFCNVRLDIVEIKSQLAFGYQKLSKFQKAADIFEKELLPIFHNELSQLMIHNPAQLCFILTNLGYCEMMLKNIARSKEVFQLAIQVAKKYGLSHQYSILSKFLASCNSMKTSSSTSPSSKSMQTNPVQQTTTTQSTTTEPTTTEQTTTTTEQTTTTTSSPQ